MRCCEFESRCSGHKQIPVMNQLVTDLEATGYGAPSSTLNHLVADTSRCVPEASSNGERCPDGYDTVVLHEYLEESP